MVKNSFQASSSVSATIGFFFFFQLFLSFPAQALSLRELVQTVLSGNLSLKAESLKIEEQTIDQKKANNLFLPNLNGKVSSNYQRYLDTTPMALFGTRTQSNLASVELVQDYPALGKANHLQRDVAKLLGTAQKVRFKMAETELIRRTVKAFFEFAREAELMKVDRQNLELIQKLHEVARLNQMAGMALPNDILRIEVEQAKTESSLSGRKFKQENIQIDLANMADLNAPEDLNITLPATLKFRQAGPDLATLSALLEARDQEIQLTRSDLEILETTLKAAQTAQLPSVSLSSKFNLANTSTNRYQSNAYNKDFSLNVTLDFPLYDSGDIKNEVSRLEKSLARTRLGLETLLKDKHAALNKALTDYREILEKIRFSDKALEQSRENMRMVATRYQQGDANIVELVDASMTLSGIAQGAISNFFEERTRLADLLLLAQDLDGLQILDLEPIHEKFLVDFADLAGS